MHAVEARKFSNIAANTAPFPLQGGQYQVAIVATWGGGNAGLQQLGPDGVTWIPAPFTINANGSYTADIPPGMYRIAVTTATAVYASVISVPTS